LAPFVFAVGAAFTLVGLQKLSGNGKLEAPSQNNIIHALMLGIIVIFYG
jgi:hypothetical protein